MTSIVYKGTQINMGAGGSWNIPGVGTFNSLVDAEAYIDSQFPGGDPSQASKNPQDYFEPAKNNWTGNIKVGVDDARENKMVALGPAPPGLTGQLEAIILLAGLNKLSKTPEGLKVIRDLGMRYLQTMGTVIQSLSLSSSANPYNCLINDYVAVKIYQRLGIISAHDQIQASAWIDHVMGMMINKSYFSDTLTGLTSLVTGLERQVPTMLK